MAVESVSSDAAAKVNSERQARRSDDKKVEEKKETESRAEQVKEEAPKSDNGGSLSVVA